MLDHAKRSAISRKNASHRHDKTPVFVGGDALFNLANAIVEKGVDDYSAALRCLRLDKRNREAHSRRQFRRRQNPAAMGAGGA